MKTKILKEEDALRLLSTLKERFEKNVDRHPTLVWNDIEVRLQSQGEKLWSLNAMEQTGGEPDVIDFDKQSGEYVFYDCAVESPIGRRSYCYDRVALDSRKANKPANNIIDVATDMGIELLTEEEYRYLQTVISFDLKTSSWIFTPDDVRKLGGALFCDRRYNKVFTYHNGAESYYAARGFRGLLRV